MATNELTARFIFDDKDGIKIDSLHKKFISLDSDLKNIGKNTVVGKTIANDFDNAGRAADQFKNKVNNSLKLPKDNDLKSALQDIKRIQLENAANEKLITKAINAESKLQADVKIREIRRADAEAKRSANDALRILNQKENILGNNSIGGLGFPLGIGAATIGISKFVDLSKQAIDITIQSEKANRLLASSATEIGLSYDKLAEKNKKFAEQNALSIREAATTTAQIARLSGATGRPQDIDKLSGAFSDLGAARGIDPKNLETLIGTILSGQDEGLNRLGIADPSKLYEAYARNIGTTADKLTQFQKAQAAANAVVDKSSIFKGAAQDRLQSFEGRIGNVTAKVDDLSVSFANSFTKSYEFNSGLDLASKFVNNLTKDVDELQRKLSNGITPTDKDFQNAAKPSFISEQASSVGRGFYRFMSGFSSLTGFQDSAKRFAEASTNLNPEYQQQYREDFIRQQANAQIRLSAQQKKAAEEQKKYYDELDKKEQDRQKSLQRQSELQRVLSNPYSTLSDLRENRDQLKRGGFFGNDKVLSDSDRIKITDDFDKAVSDGVSKGFQKSIRAENNLSGLNRILSGVNSSGELLPDAKDNLLSQIEQNAKQSIQTVKSVISDFNDSFISVRSQNNPFVKVLSDIDSVGERAQKRFGALGKEFVKMTADFEKSNLIKQLGELKFSNDLSALKLTQDVRRIDQLPNNQRFESIRGLENLNQISDFALNINNLSRKIAESNFYSDKYNPNNPKSFADYNRRGINDDISETGLQIRYAIEDIRKLNSVDLQGTGVYGQGAIADKILSVIPSRDDLLRKLNNPSTRNEAQFLLNQQSISLKDKRNFETQKFGDFFEQQKYNDLRRTDAREQLNLLNNSFGLDKEFANQQFLKVTDELGTQNLDRELLQGRRDAQLEAVKILQQQFREAQKDAADARRRNDKLEAFLDKVVQQLTGNGLKIDASNMPETIINVDAKDFNVRNSPFARPTGRDVAELYGDY